MSHLPCAAPVLPATSDSVAATVAPAARPALEVGMFWTQLPTAVWAFMEDAIGVGAECLGVALRHVVAHRNMIAGLHLPAVNLEGLSKGVLGSAPMPQSAPR